GAGLRNPSGYLPIPVTAGAATATGPRAAVGAAATDPASAGQWSSVQSWPIVAIHTTLLPNGKVLAWDTDTSGVGVQVYDPITNGFSAAPYSPANLFCAGHGVLPDGRVFVAGGTISDATGLHDATIFDPSTQTWSTVDPTILDGGSAAMYVPGKIIKSGLGRDADLSPANSVATTYVIDMTQPSPAWRQTASMAYPRNMHNLTLLPDGTVLATGGGLNSNRGDTASAVLQPELWSPATETWTVLASMQTPRLYHSTALLLPDGRVLVAGGGR